MNGFLLLIVLKVYRITVCNNYWYYYYLILLNMTQK